MGSDQPPTTAYLRRIAEELGEAGLVIGEGAPWQDLAVAELAYARRPTVHERRVPSYGAIVAPTSDPVTWEAAADLVISRRRLAGTLSGARRFADGLSSFLIRRVDGDDELAVFNRPAGSERDLVVLTAAMKAIVVQRHPTGIVRVVGSFGVLRWDGLWWQNEPLVATWIGPLTTDADQREREVIEALLEFAVHDLGARGIGAILVHRPNAEKALGLQPRLAPPPPLAISRPGDLAPLRHALGQVDGAAVFDATGTLRQMGARLVPTPAAESTVEGYRGMRHTAARRYSFDDPGATLIVVSEDGPVSVFRGGNILGASRTNCQDETSFETES